MISLSTAFKHIASVVIALWVIIAPAVAQHRLSSGDSVSVSVFRVEGFGGEATLDIDGQVAVSPLGNIHAADLTVTELATKISAELANRGIIDEALVTVALLAVRPVIVGGDVSKPGTVQFATGLTVQEAIALSGGIGRLREVGADELSRLRGAGAEAAAGLLSERARLARVKAEISGTDFDPADVTAPTSQILRDKIVNLERALAAANRTEATEQRAYLKRALDLVVGYGAALGEARQRYDVRIAEQRNEVARVDEIQGRGLAVQDSVTRERRELSALVEDAAGIESARILSQQRQAELDHDFQRFDERRQAVLTSDLQAALISVEIAESRLAAIYDELAALGDVDEGQIKVVIHRRQGEATEVIEAKAETILAPGDFLNVDLLRHDFSRRPDL